MPIYAYRCEECGFAKDVLQKMSDAPLSDCPHCGKASFKKQVTAAGFQLKGSGWYVTDFRGGNNAAAGASAPAVNTGGSEGSEAASSSKDSSGSSSSAGSSGTSDSAGTGSTSGGSDTKAA
ncbi:FmdB family zinc ribbon protein [Undibacterium sp. TJN25]|uniref:FmdB family zinc ribbon protein n=1 Tax=Undibacterium sp. TJN25 TaxID=3413056 RepID=UPI003BF3D728